jgi:L,D-peptidoglycan transpeptidase YkuD (ErfK/YbiS/YcfS/YnhG family)
MRSCGIVVLAVVGAVLIALVVAFLVAIAPSLVGAAPNPPIDRPATVTLSASRDVQWADDAVCDLTTVEAIASHHPATRQLVVLATASFGDTHGHAFVAVRDSGGAWHCQTDVVAARFGRTGTRPLLERRSGDGTTPAGVFPLGETTAWDGQVVNVFGNRPDPGVRAGIGYRAVRPQDCWGAIPNDADYNHLVNHYGCSQGDDEWLPRFGDVYAHAAVIGANMNPISGDAPGETPYAAAIFLHRHSYNSNGSTKPTSGCVSLPYDDLAATIRLLDPALNPHFAIGPVDWLRTTP